MIRKIVGPPGTGKTTTLLNYFEDLLKEGVSPDKIVFTSFTRTTTSEARERAFKKYEIRSSALPYFRTLHSLCLSLIPGAEIMNNGHWKDIARKTGYSFGMFRGNSEENPVSSKTGDLLRKLYELSRLREESLAKTIENDYRELTSDRSVTLPQLQKFKTEVEKYKLEHECMDFTDILEEWVKNGWVPPVTHIIVDEAQDFSKLQWRIIKKLTEKTEFTIIAGDDDQALYEWNGASPDNFIDLEVDETIVLPISYRIPAQVHDLATAISARIRHRIKKEFKPRKEQGEVILFQNPMKLPLKIGNWMLLGRTKKHTTSCMSICHTHGQPYTSDTPMYNVEGLRAIKDWVSMTKGESIPVEAAVNIYRFLPVKTRVKYGFKKQLSQCEKDGVTLEDLVQDFGLLNSTIPWHEQFDSISTIDLAYFRQMERANNLFKVPTIHVSTIHRAKGMEAQNVMVITDMGPMAHRNFEQHPDQEHRVWYVAFTRARERLWLYRPTTPQFYPIP